MSVPGIPINSVNGSQAHRNGYRQDHAHPSALDAAVERARRCLLALQKPDGHWVGELEGDTILESEYILLMAFLGREGEEKVAKAARYILQKQRAEGAWSTYPGGPVDLSVSVKAYFALKVAGYAAASPFLRRARELILARGGAAGCNSFTKFYLALLGQFPYDNCPTVPVEMIFLPKWAYFNIYAMSSWTRTIVVPLTIFSAFRPVRSLPLQKGIGELFLQPPETPLWPLPPARRLMTWHNFFLGLDWVLKKLEKLEPKALRRAAVQRASAWMRGHFADSDGVGAIYPPIIYTIICLRCLGYADDSAEMIYALKQLDDLMIEEGDTLRVQPCFSPVWDTALSMNALSSCGLAGVPRSEDLPALERACRWLLTKEVRRPGDWSLMNPGVEPGGWFFEYHNGFYPDTDDTAMVLMGLARSGLAWKDGVRLPAVERGLRWLLALQNQDGGWAAFDRDINKDILTKVPFADHNAMLDPSCPDITARVLEALGHYGYRPGMREVDRALAFVRQRQDPRGCWIGRWGVNYIYGTWQVLAGLKAIGFDMSDPMVRQGVDWLTSKQQANGGWGESCASYDDPTLAGQGIPTASQTAWALLGLLAAGEGDSDAVHNGIHYLVRTQQTDGNWGEDQFTGTGFPRVFYLKYHLYRLYFPLMALSRYQQLHYSPVQREQVHGPHLAHVLGVRG